MGPNYLSELLPNNCEVIGEYHTFLNLSSSSNSSNIGRDDGGNDNEDEDMANCLILLAQGEPAASQPSSFSLGKFIGDPEGQNALGGHRSSHTHKNTAITATALDHKPISSTSPANKQHEQRFNYNNNVSNQLDQVRMSRSDYYNNFKSSNNHKIKVHECSVCGADFISGQALGGHMRRHRRGCGGTSRDSSEIDRRCSKKQRSNLLCLDLNLNLPAPENDKRENLGVAMGATNLVDCHY
ncbi:zinc finger protein ZAT5-like [Cucumis melo var. makuwa]|uniref:Zinc finger protein ZAT5-like n=1 Tax=Cucumis melo var. makuwa TaxID=1194695 RepID=A0A5D3BNW6_CUCMM|nr:zinc finger protein ZAT5-like [Cucumis melo var. makuwa]